MRLPNERIIPAGDPGGDNPPDVGATAAAPFPSCKLFRIFRRPTDFKITVRDGGNGEVFLFQNHNHVTACIVSRLCCVRFDTFQCSACQQLPATRVARIAAGNCSQHRHIAHLHIAGNNAVTVVSEHCGAVALSGRANQILKKSVRQMPWPCRHHPIQSRSP